MTTNLKIFEMLNDLIRIAIHEGRAADKRYGIDEIVQTVRGNREFEDLVDAITGARDFK